MDIIVDKRDTNIIYVDKINNHVANNDEVIKLINNDNNNSVIDVYIKIITGSNNLNNTEIEILKYIMNNNNTVTLDSVYNNVPKVINKSSITISRAISNLRNKRIVYISYINNIDYVTISNSILIPTTKMNNSKFLIIELCPNITSKNISI